MSAILLGQKREERFEITMNKEEEDDTKEQKIEGKNKTYIILF